MSLTSSSSSRFCNSMLTLWSGLYNWTLGEVKVVSVGMTASISNAREKRVSPVDALVVVWYAYRTSWSLSAQLPFFESSFAFSVCFIILFTASVWLLV